MDSSDVLFFLAVITVSYRAKYHISNIEMGQEKLSPAPLAYPTPLMSDIFVKMPSVFIHFLLITELLLGCTSYTHHSTT